MSEKLIGEFRKIKYKTNKIECDYCNKKIDQDDSFQFCEACKDYRHVDENLEAIIRHVVINHNCWDRFRDTYTGFESEQEKEIFLKGTREGMKQAFFWMADMVGTVEVFEKLEHLFEYEAWKKR